jgi:hypothetical protein
MTLMKRGRLGHDLPALRLANPVQAEHGRAQSWISAQLPFVFNQEVPV